MPLEILHFTFVLLRRRARFEGAEIAATAGLRIKLSRIEPVLARFQFADHLKLLEQWSLWRVTLLENGCAPSPIINHASNGFVPLPYTSRSRPDPISAGVASEDERNLNNRSDAETFFDSVMRPAENTAGVCK
jgi:hypothetical protein